MGNSQWITTWTIDNIAQPQFSNTLSLSAELGVEYYFSAITEFGCQGEASITTDYIAPGVFETTVDFKLYPNPTRDFIIVESSFQDAVLTIHNSENKMMLHSKIFGNKKTIDLRGWSSGMYRITIQNGNQIKTAQFLISR